MPRLPPASMLCSPLRSTAALCLALLAAGVMKSPWQMHVAARVLAWALHAWSPQLAGVAGREVVVEAVVHVAGRIPSKTRSKFEVEAARLRRVAVPGQPCGATLSIVLEEV